MKITLENTTKIVELMIRGVPVPARVWQGNTSGGIRVQAFITRIAPEIPKTDPRINEKTVDFEQELQRCADPRATVEAIPMRLLID